MSKERIQEKLIFEYSTLQRSLEEMDGDFQVKLFETAQKFLISCLENMKIWLPFFDQTLFDSDVAYLKNYNLAEWMRLKDRFTNIIRKEDENSFQDEVKRLKYNFLDLKEGTIHSNISRLEKE